MPSPVSQRLHTTVQTRSIDRKNLTVDIVASTPSIDSYGTIIDQNGWDLEQFKRNPVITWAHDDRGFTGSEGLPVANAVPETVRVENGQLKMRLRFTPEDVHPFGFRVFRMISEGFVHGLSVGFAPDLDHVDTTTDSDGKQVQIYRSCKLLETAVVTIPSNDDALIQRQLQKLNRESEFEKVRAMARDVEEMAKTQKRDDGDQSMAVDGMSGLCDRAGCRGSEAEKTCTLGEQCDCRCHGKRTVKGEKNGAVVVSAIELEEFNEFRSDFGKYKTYFERKQPANRASTKVLKKFFTDILQEEQPADEVQAWERMNEALMVAVRSDGDNVVPSVAPEAPVVEAPVVAPEVVPAPEVAAVEAQVVEAIVAPESPVEPPVVEPVIEQAPEPAPEVASAEAIVEEKPVDLNAPVTGTATTTVEVKEETPIPPSTQPMTEEAPPSARKAFVHIPLADLAAFSLKIKRTFEEAAAEALRQGYPREKLDDLFTAVQDQILRG